MKRWIIQWPLAFVRLGFEWLEAMGYKLLVVVDTDMRAIGVIARTKEKIIGEDVTFEEEVFVATLRGREVELLYEEEN